MEYHLRHTFSNLPTKEKQQPQKITKDWIIGYTSKEVAKKSGSPKLKLKYIALNTPILMHSHRIMGVSLYPQYSPYPLAFCHR